MQFYIKSIQVSSGDKHVDTKEMISWPVLALAVSR